MTTKKILKTLARCKGIIVDRGAQVYYTGNFHVLIKDILIIADRGMKRNSAVS